MAEWNSRKACHCLLSFILVGSPVYGQGGGAQIFEELVVTARKREQNLQDVAVGVSLLSGKAMAEAQLRNATELTTLIPTLNLQDSSGSGTSEVDPEEGCL